jgi:hypothetical protein
MCDCTTRINEKLAQFGGRLAMGLRINPETHEVTGRLLIATEKTDKSRRKPVPIVAASFCPFCGEEVTDAAKGDSHD